VQGIDLRDIVLFALLAGVGYAAVAFAINLGRRLRGDGEDIICRDPNCGEKNPAGARYCARCGRELI